MSDRQELDLKEEMSLEDLYAKMALVYFSTNSGLQPSGEGGI